MRFRPSLDWLKHAFAVDDPQVDAPTDPEREVADRLCRAVVERRLTPAALVFLETCRPLNFLGSQALHFFMPLIGLVADAEAATRFAQFLERRGSVDYLAARLEQLESEKWGTSPPGPDSAGPLGQSEPLAEAGSTSCPQNAPHEPSQRRSQNQAEQTEPTEG